MNSNLPKTMNAVLLTGHGGMEKLEYRSDVEVPIPKDDEVLINVKAAGINNTDINTRTGWYSKSSVETQHRHSRKLLILFSYVYDQCIEQNCDCY